MISHEIRTPMTAMLGVADLLRDEVAGSRQKKLLDKLAGSGESLLRIINDILDFSKIEAERLELRPKPFEAAGLLDRDGSAVRRRASGQESGVRHRSRIPTDRGLTGDRQRLSQVLLNLGTNAMKFTDRGEVRR